MFPVQVKINTGLLSNLSTRKLEWRYSNMYFFLRDFSIVRRYMHVSRKKTCFVVFFSTTFAYLEGILRVSRNGTPYLRLIRLEAYIFGAKSIGLTSEWVRPPRTMIHCSQIDSWLFQPSDPIVEISAQEKESRSHSSCNMWENHCAELTRYYSPCPHTTPVLSCSANPHEVIFTRGCQRN